MTIGSLFSGIGGFELGLEWAGIGPVKWQVEIDPYCQKVLAKHWPEAKRYGDIHNVGKHNLEPVELICGGFPCQPYSVAGKHGGAEDDRALWPEMRRVIAELMPRWVIGENVSGFIRMGLDQAVSDLENLGYSVQAYCIPAVAVGAWHERKRVWIVAHSLRTGQPPMSTSRGQDSEGKSGGRAMSARSSGRGAESLAHRNSEWKPQPEGTLKEIRERTGDGSKSLSNSAGGENIGRERGDMAEAERARGCEYAAARSGGEDVPNANSAGRGEYGGASHSIPLNTLVTILPLGEHGEDGTNPQAPIGGKLNPEWVEWLMGYPVGWTDCERSETQ